MAEKEVVDGGGVAANRPTGPDVPVRGSADELIVSAPEPTDDETGKIYRVLYPNDHFVMEGHPVVNTAGVRLTKEQADAILPAAEASGVLIEEVQ
jgi:hypothetical protein